MNGLGKVFAYGAVGIGAMVLILGLIVYFAKPAWKSQAKGLMVGGFLTLLLGGVANYMAKPTAGKAPPADLTTGGPSYPSTSSPVVY